jgi:hypothetical protein
MEEFKMELEDDQVLKERYTWTGSVARRPA